MTPAQSIHHPKPHIQHLLAFPFIEFTCIYFTFFQLNKKNIMPSYVGTYFFLLNSTSPISIHILGSPCSYFLWLLFNMSSYKYSPCTHPLSGWWSFRLFLEFHCDQRHYGPACIYLQLNKLECFSWVYSEECNCQMIGGRSFPFTLHVKNHSCRNTA